MVGFGVDKIMAQAADRYAPFDRPKISGKIQRGPDPYVRYGASVDIELRQGLIIDGN